MDGTWTLSELSEQVAGVLGDGYAGQASGRVRDVPDARTIRWYTTIGLVDRPSGMRGRTALYGHRHMLQLVAIKRLQARGLSLAEIQRLLIGATDAELAQTDPASAAPPAAQPAEAPRHTEPAGAPPAWSGLAAEARQGPPAHRRRFWAAGGPEPPAAEPSAQPVYGITLADGVTLVLGARQPDPAVLAEIAAAAGPLLDTLRRLQLISSSAKGPS